MRTFGAKSSQYVVVTCSRADVAIFRVVDVNQAPLSSSFAIDLRLDTMGGHGRSAFARCCPKDPVEFRPRRVSIHVNRRAACLKIARREHATHDVLKDMLLDGIESVLFTQWIDERDLGLMRPDFRQQVQVDRVDRFGISLYEVMVCRDVGGRPGIVLGRSARWDEQSDNDERNTTEHRCFIVSVQSQLRDRMCACGLCGFPGLAYKSSPKGLLRSSSCWSTRPRSAH